MNETTYEKYPTRVGTKDLHEISLTTYPSLCFDAICNLHYYDNADSKINNKDSEEQKQELVDVFGVDTKWNVKNVTNNKSYCSSSKCNKCIKRKCNSEMTKDYLSPISYKLAKKEDYRKRYSTDLLENFRLSVLASMKNLDNFKCFLDDPLQQLCDTVKSDLEKSSNYTFPNILHLYKKFLDTKFGIFERRCLRGYDNVVYSEHIFETLRGTNILIHQAYSMVAVFGKESTTLVNPNFLKIMQKGDEEIGIITHVDSDNGPIFVHETFAEYFAATWFAENWIISDMAKKFLLKVFFLERYSMVKLCFDMIVSKDLDLFQAVLDQNKEKIQHCKNFSVDELGRTPLHLICSWKSKIDRDCLKILMENIDPTSEFDDLGLTPFDYAARTKNVVALDEMLKKHSYDLSTLEICTDIKWLLHKCMEEECKQLPIHVMKLLNSSED